MGVAIHCFINPSCRLVLSWRFRGVFFAGIFVLFSSISDAQLCQGSLGDPIVNLDFGSGTSTHGSPLAAGITSYSYSSADFPMDGSYTIENSTAGSGSVWWSTTDHTGNPGGYMMVVNASLSLTDYFYKNTITGLCPGTLYEFAAWVMNLLRSTDLSPPNITFLIEKTDGSVINSYTTGSIALQSGPLWRQFGFYFTTPTGVSTVIVVMRNNSAGGAPANDIALDDITFRPCGPNVSAWVYGSTITSVTVCEDSDLPVHFQGSVSAGYNNTEYQWQQQVNGTWQDVAGATSLDMSLPLGNYPAGTYLFRMAAGETANFSSLQCRVVSNLVTLVVEPAPVARFGLTSRVVCANQSVQFIDSTQSAGTLVYAWAFGDGGTATDKNPAHVYNEPGTYSISLIVKTPDGCADTAIKTENIQMIPIPVAKFTISPTDTSIFHPTITFSDESSSSSGCKIDWGDGTITDCNITQHGYSEPGTFLVKEIVENTAGCYDTAFAKVIIRPEFYFSIPNAFTPNGDGVNDVFQPILFGVFEYSFLVFNRWGQQLFETDNPSVGWNGYFNGELCSQETYVYKITFRDEVEKKVKIYSGTFMLLKR